MTNQNLEQSIFLHAIGMASPVDRAAYLDQACRENAELRLEVDALLAAHDRLGVALPFPTHPETTRVPFASHAETSGSAIGPYKLLEQIGQGGMGVVWMAEQKEPIHRRVALKVIKAGMDSKQVLARFEAERQALALMDHPNIARVLDAGVTGTGRPYFVMELVKGAPITQYCDSKHFSVRERLELFGDVCRAVQHAHQKGIIHRDLKPSNILIAPFDGKPVVKVIDFGVAKATGQRLTDATLFTGFGAVLGTPEYMSPEQAETNNQDIDTRSDIYSLGVLLYELLTGSTPLTKNRVREAALLEVLRVIREEEPPRPSTRLSSTEELPSISAQRHTEPAKLTSLLRGELDWIVMKAIEKDRNRRYETANGFAQDVQRYLANEPILACPPSAVYRLRKFAHRNRGPVAAGLLIAISLVAAMLTFAVQSIRLRIEQARTLEQQAIAIRQSQRADDRAREAVKQKQLMEKEKSRAEKSLYDASIMAAARAIGAQRYDQARQLLNDCPSEHRNWEWGRLLYLCNLDLMTIAAHAGPARTAVFSPDGSTIVSGGEDAQVKIFRAATGEQLRVLVGHGERVNAVAFDPNGTLLASASGSDQDSTDNSIRLWNPATGELLATLNGHSAKVCSLAFSSDGRRLASGAGDHQVIIWDVAARREDRRLLGHRGPVLDVAFHPKGEMVASTGWIPESDLKLWDVRDGTLLKSVTCGTWGLACAGFNPDGAVLAASGKDGRIYRMNTANFEPMPQLPGAQWFVSSLAYHPERDEIALASRNSALIVAGTQARDAPLRMLEGPQGAAWSVNYDRDGKRVVVAFNDGTVRVFDATRMDAGSISSGVQTQGIWPFVWSLAVSSDGATVATSINDDHYARVWNGRSGSERLNVGPHPETVSWVALTPDGTQLVTMSDRPRLWDLKSQKYSSFIDATSNDRFCAALDGDGKLLITGAVNGDVKLWDMRTRKSIRILRGKGGQVSRVALNLRGTVAATAESETVVLWDTSTGERLRDLGSEAGNARAIAFSHDGRLITIGSDKITPKLWEVESGRLLGQCIGHSENVWAVAFSPDGRRLVTGSSDGTARVWDVHSQRELMTIDSAGRSLYAIAFSSDGRWLVAGGRSQRPEIVVWPTLPWSAATYPANSGLREAAVEAEKRKYWQSYEAAREDATRLTNIALDPQELAAIRRTGWERKLAALNDEVWAKPDDPDPLTRRAQLCIRSGRFEQALPDFDRLVLLAPTDHYHWYQCACLLAYLGREAEYRAHCRAMLEQFADSQDKYVLERTAKGTLLLPPVDPEDVQPLIVRASKAKAMDANDPGFVPWVELLMGIAEYRAGGPDAAVPWLESCRSAHETDAAARTATAEAFLAMAHHRQGDNEGAKAALARCVRLIEKDLPKAGVDDLIDRTGGSENWLIAHTARREAERETAAESSTLQDFRSEPAAGRE